MLFYKECTLLPISWNKNCSYRFVLELEVGVDIWFWFYYMANWSIMKWSILIGSLSGPNFAIIYYGPLRCTAHELISPNSFYETIEQKKTVSRTIFPYSSLSVWQTISVKLFANWSEKCKYMLNFGVRALAENGCINLSAKF